ncbi:MAG: sulfatase-like hydrolase/transferase [bacterium]|nr:sulfatase-like hydrolase/transferase [bacterium]
MKTANSASQPTPLQRRFNQIIASGRTCLFSLLLFILALPGLAADRPNVLLCMADDQGWGDTAYNGHPVLKTPNLDTMAASGLRFDQFYAAAPVCSPTRGSVLTGRNPNRFACYSWGHPLRPQEVTIAERLQAAGYATGHFGKWHLGSVLKDSPVNPANSGFDAWLSAFNFYDNNPILSREGVAVELQGESSMIAADAAIDFMREQALASRPFLAVVWFGSPHSPHRAADEDREQYRGNRDADWLGEITGLDRAVGKLRQALDEMGVRENTLFWYTSDNGGLKTESSGGRGKKADIYEGGLRVPAIIEWPNRIREPRVTRIPSNTADIYPTLLDVLDITPTHQPRLDGISLLPVIDNQTQERTQPMGFWKSNQGGISTPSDRWMREELGAQQAGREYHDRSRLMVDAGEIHNPFPPTVYPGHAAWLAWPWKLHRIESDKRKAGKVTWELYNLENDPLESRDRLSDEKDRVSKMQNELEEWLHSVVASIEGRDYQ